MKLTFLGATHEVTGSCYYLEACGKKILIDCGMEQGRDCFENQDIPVGAQDIDMILLTHAHIDHSGKLPLMSKMGFKGIIYSTEATRQLCQIMLLDSAHIQEFEVEWKNRKAQRAGRPMVEPMYTTEDAQNIMKCFVGLEYNKEIFIDDNIRVRFTDAGHLLGSASIEVWIKENGVEKKILFSGDIGNLDQPLICNPSYPEQADYVVMESTYGDRSHEKPADYAVALAEVLQKTFDRGGNVVIPAFAVGRTQEMLYFIRRIKQEKMVKGHDGFTVFVDSPLAVDATGIFMKRMYEDFNQEALDLINQGINPIGFDGLRVAVTAEESKNINFDNSPKVILSSSGMCDAGRIKHHLKHNLWRPESSVVFVGYQAEGTIGRKLMEGADSVKLFGEEIEVRADIVVLPGISGHADNNGLLRWISSLKEKPAKVFVCHGDDEICQIFRDRLTNELGLDAYAPYSGTRFDLAAGTFEYEAEPIPVIHEETEDEARQNEPQITIGKFAFLYEALERASEHLAQVVRQNRGGTNRDLKKFTRDIEELCKKWER